MSKDPNQQTPRGSEKVTQAGTKVTVACKLPGGLILHIDEMVEHDEPSPGGMRTVRKARQVGGTIHINGNAVALGKTPRHRIAMPDGLPFTDGFALTPNVPKDFWDRWLEQNKDSDLVKNNLIYAFEKPADAVDFSKEAVSQRSGLEPLMQDRDPRAPRMIRRSERNEEAA